MKLELRIDLDRRGLHVLLNPGSKGRGFVIKPVWRMIFSEREGYWRGFRIWPLYFRTFTKRQEAKIWSKL